jgi:hypothetical protein
VGARLSRPPVAAYRIEGGSRTGTFVRVGRYLQGRLHRIDRAGGRGALDKGAVDSVARKSSRYRSASTRNACLDRGGTSALSDARCRYRTAWALQTLRRFHSEIGGGRCGRVAANTRSLTSSSVAKWSVRPWTPAGACVHHQVTNIVFSRPLSTNQAPCPYRSRTLLARLLAPNAAIVAGPRRRIYPQILPRRTAENPSWARAPQGKSRAVTQPSQYGILSHQCSGRPEHKAAPLHKYMGCTRMRSS